VVNHHEVGIGDHIIDGNRQQRAVATQYGPAVSLDTAPFSGSCRTMKYYLELSYPTATNSQNTADAIIRRAIGIQAAGSGVGYNRSIGAHARDAGWYFPTREAAQQVRDRLLQDASLKQISGLIILEIEAIDDDDDDDGDQC
jgi:hypothetical protein